MKLYHWAKDIQLIFQFKGSLLRRLSISLLGLVALTLLLTFLHHEGIFILEISLSLPGLLGAVIGLLLVFRNNTAYDRWWEARKILGGLVNTSRNFAMQVKTLVHETPDKDRKIFHELLVAFVISLKEHLRNGVKLEDLKLENEELKAQIAQATHKPNRIIQLLLARIRSLYDQQVVTDFQMLKLIENTDELVDILGKCERIHNTPIPMSHNYVLRVCVFVYALVLPFSLIATLGWLSFIAVALIFYFMMSIIIIAEEIEDPFGYDNNDLQVDKIVQNIENNLVEIFSFSDSEIIASNF
jgi:putative membrane protein